MHISVTELDFHDAFEESAWYSAFSSWALSALFKYLTKLESDTGTSIELNVYELSCTYREETAEFIHSEYDTGIDRTSGNKMDKEFNAEVYEWLKQRTTVIAVSKYGNKFLFVNF